MPINTSRISASELDFDAIKTNLKEFMRSQAQFTDYDFEGSTLSALLDVLAYNTHYRALYDNFIINEMFLDSASKRNSVVSRAKELGYVPRSIKASIGYIDFKLQGTTGGPELYILPKYSQFTASVNGTNYNFVTMETYSTSGSGGTYEIEGVKLVQGDLLTQRFLVAEGSSFVLPNEFIDTDTLTVKVQDSSSSSVYHTFNRTEELTGIASTDRVFWLKEVEGGMYELEFGNDVIGKALVNGNVVHAEYVVTSGEVANGAKLFKYSGFNLFGGTTVLSTTSAAAGGTPIEDISSIKFNAPRAFTAQNRAVTVEDYRNLTYSLVPEASSINVWSGADVSPPEYGKVFICIKPTTVEKFTAAEKLAIKNTLMNTKGILTVIPEIIDPQYIKVAIDSTIYYDPKSTVKSSNDIKLLVQAAIANYSSTSLQKFDSVLRFSKLSRIIDDSDSAIVSNVSSITLKRVVEPKYNQNSNYSIKLINPIHNEKESSSVQSSGFHLDSTDTIYYMEDDGIGNLVIYTITGGEKQVTNSKAGTVDYGTGTINIPGLRIITIEGSEFIFTIKPSSYDVISVLDQLVTIPTDQITVDVIADKSLGGSGAGTNYVFTSSRS